LGELATLRLGDGLDDLLEESKAKNLLGGDGIALVDRA